ncbi:hypothetical protein PAP_07175 [Palaeococcus pacificus DY20341]|uniref:Uncharacterized protein n=1 Tax=Palaeococcus pacificus DY20341 TaxID=1343739 RepID=A0A075LSU6_9EURY|nr:hypothetical protein PAP_07175 [Palaeococcus pacificus DY20341]
MEIECIRDVEIWSAIENFELMLSQLIKRIKKEKN